eukprot:3626054-Prymnesium_polylepis.1
MSVKVGGPTRHAQHDRQRRAWGTAARGAAVPMPRTHATYALHILVRTPASTHAPSSSTSAASTPVAPMNAPIISISPPPSPPPLLS